MKTFRRPQEAGFVAPRGAVALVACGALAWMPGCRGDGASGDAPVEASPPASVTVEANPIRDMGYRLAWQGSSIISRRASVKHVDVTGGLVLVHTTSNTLSVLDTSTGRILWSRDMGSPLKNFVGNERIDDERLLIASEGQLFYLDARTGELLDRQDLASLASTDPVIAGNLVLMGTETGELLAHNMLSGVKQWGYQLRGSIDARPVDLGGPIGVVSSTGDVLVVQPGRIGESTALRRVFDGATASPVGDANTIYVASLDQSLWAINTNGGDVRWRTRTSFPLTDQPTLDNGVLYQAIPRRGLVAFDAASGDETWTLEGVRGSVIGAIGDDPLLWDGAALHRLDGGTGQVITSAPLDDVAEIVVDGFRDGDLYVVRSSGEVLKYVRSGRS